MATEALMLWIESVMDEAVALLCEASRKEEDYLQRTTVEVPAPSCFRLRSLVALELALGARIDSALQVPGVATVAADYLSHA